MSQAISNTRGPGVIFPPASQQALRSGFRQIVNLLRPTLGPQPRTVVVSQPILDGKPPEVLDNGGLIARRVLELPDGDVDVGAMFLRQLICHMTERVGDGSATAAVLFEAVYEGGFRYVTAGGSAPRLRQALNCGLRLVLDELQRQARPLRGRSSLASLAAALCYDEELAAALGEIFNIIGSSGRFELREDQGRQIRTEYVEGSYWDGGLLSPALTEPISPLEKAGTRRLELSDAAVLVSDLDIREPQELVAVLEAAHQANAPGLVLLAHSIAPAAMALLLDPRNRTQLPVIAARGPSTADDGPLLDIAALTGARALLQAAGDHIASVRAGHLGHTRRAWADADFVGLIGGQADPLELRRRLGGLQAAWALAEEDLVEERLAGRVATLVGGAGVIWIGAHTPTGAQRRKAMAERTARTLRSALREGVVPGGGAALLACRPVMRRSLAGTADPDERAAYEILLTALAAPARTLLKNAGREPGQILAGIEAAGPGFGYDLNAGRIVDMAANGIVDAVAMQSAAIQSAVAGAALALTTEVLVHRRKPPVEFKP